jgi:hypothetical protein
MKYQKLSVGWSAFWLAALTAVGNPSTATAQLSAPDSAPSSEPSSELETTPTATSSPEAVAPLSPILYFASDLAPDSTPDSAPDFTEQSPVFQRWTQEVPDLQSAIRNDPSFVTRIQAGYSFFPSSEGSSGYAVGVEDWFVGTTPLTVSADYHQNDSGTRQAYGVDLHYYVLPLGDYFNVAPVVGYRHAESANDYSVSGANIGVRLRFVPSRTGAADLTVDHTWIVGDSQGLSITQINAGYAIAQNLRLSADFEWQSTAEQGDSRVGLNMEWAL